MNVILDFIDWLDWKFSTMSDWGIVAVIAAGVLVTGFVEAM